MQETPAAEVESAARTRRPRRWRRVVFVFAVVALLLGLPWWTLLAAGTQWPPAAVIVGTAVFVSAFVGLPLLMTVGHGRRRQDWAAVSGDTLLGVLWVLFVWSALALVLRVALTLAGIEEPGRSRIIAAAVVATVVVLLAWGFVEAMRVPRVKHVDVAIPRLGSGLDGVRIAVITDTHYGPIDRTRWSRAVVERVNALDADVVCHVGDIADGTVAMRKEQARPLADARARLARAYVTGNHEYFGEAQGWLDYMHDAGWDALHNRHIVVERDGHRLILAGVDDATAGASGVAGHGADIQAALDNCDPMLPVVLLAHQPKQVAQAMAAGVDLQISGHTHGGQIWPFHLLVKLDQPVVHGLSRHGERTALYTSRGTGFWGPPFRVFAPSEITVLTLTRSTPSPVRRARRRYRPPAAAGAATDRGTRRTRN